MLIYIVEDDNNIQEIEEYALKSSGFEVKCFDNAISFQKEIKNELPDLILLDIMLPGEDGLSVLGKLRSNSRTEIDTVKGLDLGADDYITKPFGVMELISRVKALLRRIQSDEEPVLSYKNLEIDVVRHVCLVNGVQIELTYKEYELLKLFMSNIGIVMSRDSIMNSVWGFDYVGESRTIDMHIKTLRKKLGDAGVYIITVRNVGYKLE